MLDAFVHRLCQRSCWHNRRICNKEGECLTVEAKEGHPEGSQVHVREGARSEQEEVDALKAENARLQDELGYQKTWYKGCGPRTNWHCLAEYDHVVADKNAEFE